MSFLSFAELVLRTSVLWHKWRIVFFDLLGFGACSVVSRLCVFSISVSKLAKMKNRKRKEGAGDIATSAS